MKKVKKVKVKTPAQLKKELWELCKTIVRARDGNVCVICNKSNLEASGWHTGHFLPSGSCGAFLRYDLRNLHSSCYNCNINLGGNGAMFYKVLVIKFGQDFVDKLFIDKQKIVKADVIFYANKIAEYKKIQNWSKSELLNHTKVYTGIS